MNQLVNNRKEGFWKNLYHAEDKNNGYLEDDSYECNYINGVEHGVYKRFRDEVLIEIGEYHYGKKINIWKRYNLYGIIVSEINYYDGVGKLIDYCLYYGSTSVITYSTIDGKCNGWRINHYNKAKAGNCVIKEKRLYKDDEIIYIINCETNGQRIFI
jgi:hypothetical protein